MHPSTLDSQHFCTLCLPALYVNILIALRLLGDNAEKNIKEKSYLITSREQVLYFYDLFQLTESNSSP